MKLGVLISEILTNDLERFREPLKMYVKRQFYKEYNDQQMLLFGLTMDELIDSFLDKILSLKVNYSYSTSELPRGHYDANADEIDVEGIDQKKYWTQSNYSSYMDSVIYHELVHAVDYHKKMWNKVAYDILELGDKYYGDPEEIRAYSAQMRIFLIDFIGLKPDQAERMMNKYSTDQSDTRKKWMRTYKTMTEALDHELPPYLYHGTFNMLVPEIQQKGLIPRGTAFRNYEDIEWGVYLTDNWNLAGSMVETSANMNIPDQWFQNIVILVVSTKRLDINKFDLDPQLVKWKTDVLSSYVYKGNISPDEIISIVDYV